MKFIKSLLAAALFCGLITVQAQTNAPTSTTNAIANLIPSADASFLDGLKEAAQAVTSGTNWDVIGGYGHSLSGNNSLEFVDVAYDFNANVGIVLGYDALEGNGTHEFNSIKGGVTVQVDIYPLKWTGINALENIKGTPFVGDLIATSPGGNVADIVTTGINFYVWSFDSGKFIVDAGAQYENRIGDGQFDGNYVLAHVGIHRSF